MRFTSLTILLAPLTLTLAQAPFPIATKSLNSAQASSISTLAYSLGISLGSQPEYTSLADYMANAQDLTSDEYLAYNQAGSNPVELAGMYFTATATPAWYTEIPSDLKAYVASVASAEAAIATQVTGGAEKHTVALTGALLGAVLAGMLVM